MKKLIAGPILFALLLSYVVGWAQSSPKITGSEPAAAKVGAPVTINGENLGKDIVEGVYFSDDEKDYPAETAEQSATKIVVKVPELKAGGYNIALKVGNNIFIQPVRVTIE